MDVSNEVNILLMQLLKLQVLFRACLSGQDSLFTLGGRQFESINGLNNYTVLVGGVYLPKNLRLLVGGIVYLPKNLRLNADWRVPCHIEKKKKRKVVFQVLVII